MGFRERQGGKDGAREGVGVLVGWDLCERVTEGWSEAGDGIPALFLSMETRSLTSLLEKEGKPPKAFSVEGSEVTKHWWGEHGGGNPPLLK